VDLLLHVRVERGVLEKDQSGAARTGCGAHGRDRRLGWVRGHVGHDGSLSCDETCVISARTQWAEQGLGASTYTAVAARGAGVTRRGGDGGKEYSWPFVLLQQLVLEFAGGSLAH
jgi:hypothetical protein